VKRRELIRHLRHTAEAIPLTIVGRLFHFIPRSTAFSPAKSVATSPFRSLDPMGSACLIGVTEAPLNEYRTAQPSQSGGESVKLRA